jgi:hypothetical protein
MLMHRPAKWFLFDVAILDCTNRCRGEAEVTPVVVRPENRIQKKRHANDSTRFEPFWRSYCPIVGTPNLVILRNCPYCTPRPIQVPPALCQSSSPMTRKWALT